MVSYSVTWLMVAWFSHEKVSPGNKPLHAALEHVLRLLVAEVHEEPVAEHQIKAASGKIQPAGRDIY